MKFNTKQTIIYKISTNHLKKKNRNIQMDFKKAMQRNELITIGDNQFFRALDDYSEEKGITIELSKIGKNKTLYDFMSLYDSNKYRFTNAIVNVVMNSNKEYDIITKKGFFIDDIKYVEYLGTTGGVKSSNVFYIREDLYKWAWNRINNGRNEKKEFIPNKLQAYKSLDMSASSLVTQPKKYTVVKDCFVKFKDSVIELGIDENETPFENIIDDYDIKLDTNDGFGLISPKMAEVWGKDLGYDYIPSVFIIRNSFCKGALVTFDFVDYANKNNNGEYWVKDVWGNDTNIKDADFILTSSMLKLYDSYKDIFDYQDNCNNNNYKFCVTKTQKKELDNERLLNYQFIQPMELSNDDIEKLCNKTLTQINDVVNGDYYKRLLFLSGENMTHDKVMSLPNDYVKALMISEKMMNDPYVIHKTKKMIYKKAEEAKFGKVAVNGNFTIISGDPYALCQNMFGHKVTGLLSANELYMKYWADRGVNEVCALRAPMSSVNNIKKLKIVSNEKMDYWYRYMYSCSILNTWDTSSHTLNGLDHDGDLLFTTDDEVFMRNIPNTKSVVCIQSSGKKIIPTKEDYHKANKKGFSNKIGTITNKGATMYDLKSLFDKDSKEYEELDRRIRYIQLYQQMEIDALKGIKVSQMPKYWYDYKKVEETDTFNISLLADKKPYFMTYIYPRLKTKYNKHQQKYVALSRRMFQISLDELLSKENRTEQEEMVANNYYKYMPVSSYNGTMNKLCRYVESKIENILIGEDAYIEKFDKSILKSNIEYTNEQYNGVKKFYKEYLKNLSERVKGMNKTDKDSKNQFNIDKKTMIKVFKNDCLELCGNYEVLTDVMVDVCYTSDKNKEFCWLICGNQLIKNLIKNEGGTFTFMEKDENGDVEFNGNKFTTAIGYIGA